MLNKIYPIALTISVVIMAVLTYLAYSQLQSVGFAPTVIAANYLDYISYYQQFLWLSSAILLILANILLWNERKSWSLWATLVFFVFFVLLNGWGLNGMFSDYKGSNFPPDSNFSTTGLFSAVICIIAAVAVYFNQYIVLRMRERMYPVKESISDPLEKLPDETAPEEKSPDSEI